MKLYYAPGTISLMPHVALLESGLSFVAVRVDEASKKMADGEDYNAINPLGYVPALVLDDGSVLLEAAAIAQYIADRDSTGKLAPPHGTIQRARLQAWLNFLSSEMHKGGLGPLFYTALDERAKDIFRERLRARFAFVDQHLSTREYLLGKDYSIADAGLYAMTGWTPRVALIFAPTRTWSRITLGSPIATLYVKFIGSRGLSRHDPWTVRFGYQASRGRFIRSWHQTDLPGRPDDVR